MRAKIIFGMFLLTIIPFSIIFSFEFSNGFVLGETILKSIGFSIYSNGKTGWYFPGIIALFLLAIGWIGSSKLLKNKYPTLNRNIFGFILILVITLKNIN